MPTSSSHGIDIAALIQARFGLAGINELYEELVDVLRNGRSARSTPRLDRLILLLTAELEGRAAASRAAGAGSSPAAVAEVFRPFQVESLFRYQLGPWGDFYAHDPLKPPRMHPFTRPNRGDERHFVVPYAEDKGVLIPTVRGWVCMACGYTQDWAHDFMKDWGRPRSAEEERKDDVGRSDQAGQSAETVRGPAVGPEDVSR